MHPECLRYDAQVPGEHLDALWPGYEHFETASAGRNNLAAQRFVEEARPRYVAAGEAWVRRSALLNALDRDALPEHPGLSPHSATFSAQKEAWKAFIVFEKENVQNLDKLQHRVRVDLAYQQALQPLAGCPDVRFSPPRITCISALKSLLTRTALEGAELSSYKTMQRN